MADIMSQTAWAVFYDDGDTCDHLQALFANRQAAIDYCQARGATDAGNNDYWPYSIGETLVFESLDAYNRTPWQQGGGAKDG